MAPILTSKQKQQDGARLSSFEFSIRISPSSVVFILKYYNELQRKIGYYKIRSPFCLFDHKAFLIHISNQKLPTC